MSSLQAGLYTGEEAQVASEGMFSDPEPASSARSPTPENLGALLEGFRPRLERMLAIRIDPQLRRRVEVADVLQEAFVEVTRRLEEYRSSGSAPFFLWVRYLTGQKLLEIHRRHLGTERRDRGREISTPFPAASSFSLAEAFLDPGPSPSENAARDEEKQRIQQALERLDEIDREALVLRYFERLTNEEMADVLGLTTSGAKKRHLRALTHDFPGSRQDFSSGPSSFLRMAGPEESPEELEELLERILEEKRRGGSPDLEDIARRHPEFAADIEEMLPALEMLERVSERVSDDPPASAPSSPRVERPGSALGARVPSVRGPGDRTAFLSRTLERLAGRTLPFQRYQRKDEIGRGGQGAVFSVWDEDLHRTLAMKVTLGPKRKGSSSTEQRSLGRFLDEAQVTAQLDHPGIVPVHELGVDAQGGVYFTMKLVQGRDLRAIFELVQRGEEGWSRTRALNVLLKVCEAMAYAHSKGVIHRDLKPSNVMVGSFGEVYVMDWGLARILGEEDHWDLGIQRATTSALPGGADGNLDSPLVTLEGDVLGTPAYMSPEQARGELQAISRQSDVYSLGAMLYHLLAGHMPYVPAGEQPSNRAILARVQRGPPEALDRSTPRELVSICEKAMAREAPARYTDMGAVADDLRAFLENRVVAAHGTGALVELRKWVGRNRALAGSIAAGILAVVAGLVGSLVLKNAAQDHRPKSRRR